MKNKSITVTSPLLPELSEFESSLKDIWNKKWLTNNGSYHQQLEQELCDYLKVSNISLISNGTLALMLALRALDIKGEVITTPYSFVATSSVLAWLGIKPVFVDIEPNTFNLDPEKIESAITEKTTAIVPVHVYGNPCDHKAIEKIANKYNLKVIYDAAHAFGVEKDNSSILNFGDASILSFHATKVYSTIEGGAVICRDQHLKQKIDQLKSFGFVSECDVPEVGINAKLNEIQAAFGILNLKQIDEAISNRKKVALRYHDQLRGIKGLRLNSEIDGVKHTYSYFPVLIDEEICSVSRNDVYHYLAEHNILARRYFYPLISEMDAYKEYVTDDSSLSIAKQVSEQVLCLPLHQDLTDEDVDRVCILLKEKMGLVR